MLDMKFYELLAFIFLILLSLMLKKV